MRLVDQHGEALGTERILRTLEIPVSTFYDWRRAERDPCARRRRDVELLAVIREIHAESDGVYGSPRIHAMLLRRGERVSRKRVERLMRDAGITGVCPSRKVCTTVRNLDDALSDDLVERDFTAVGPDRLWVTDLTMVPTGQGPLWLASIKDAFSKRIVGWHTSPVADTALVLTALEYAVSLRKPPSDGSLIHHADHGSQYTSIALTTRLAQAGIAASMGTVGDSYDNALAENMWSVIKTERLRRRVLETRADAERELFDYIDRFYNTRRIQKGLGWRSPDEYEAAYRAGEDLSIPATRRQASGATGRTTGPGALLGRAPPGTGRNRDRGEPRKTHTPPSPRERRGVGQRPTVIRPTPESTNPNKRILTNANQP